MAGSELEDIAVVPEVPREDEPIITAFKLNNLFSHSFNFNSIFFKGLNTPFS
jgi:hypothetical protein